MDAYQNSQPIGGILYSVGGTHAILSEVPLQKWWADCIFWSKWLCKAHKIKHIVEALVCNIGIRCLVKCKHVISLASLLLIYSFILLLRFATFSSIILKMNCYMINLYEIIVITSLLRVAEAEHMVLQSRINSKK